MSLIHSVELNVAKPFDYLVALLRHHEPVEAVEAAPADWMPWNYATALARAREGRGSSAGSRLPVQTRGQSHRGRRRTRTNRHRSTQRHETRLAGGQQILASLNALQREGTVLSTVRVIAGSLIGNHGTGQSDGHIWQTSAIVTHLRLDDARECFHGQRWDFFDLVGSGADLGSNNVDRRGSPRHRAAATSRADAQHQDRAFAQATGNPHTQPHFLLTNVKPRPLRMNPYKASPESEIEMVGFSCLFFVQQPLSVVLIRTHVAHLIQVLTEAGSKPYANFEVVDLVELQQDTRLTRAVLRVRLKAHLSSTLGANGQARAVVEIVQIEHPVFANDLVALA